MPSVNRGNGKRLAGLFPFFIFFILFGSVLTPGNAGSWFADAGVQFARGDYTFETPSTNVYLYGGIRYQERNWNASINLPLLIQNNDLVNRAGDMFYPTGGDHHGNDGGAMSPHHGGSNLMGHDTAIAFGLGDVYLNGEFLVYQEKNMLPSLYVSARAKLPTASVERNLGTGKFDAGGGLSLRKRFTSTVIFADAGYLMIGDPEGVNYKDPVIFGAGIGRFFVPNKLSMLIYGQAYTEILEGVDPPRYGSFGLFYNVNMKNSLSLMVSAGLSETSPDISFGLGYSYEL